MNKAKIYGLIFIILLMFLIISEKNSIFNKSIKIDKSYKKNNKIKISEEDFDINTLIMPKDENHIDNVKDYTLKGFNFNVRTFDNKQFDEIVTLIRKNELNQALDMIDLLEKKVSPSDLEWIIYLKAHINFLKKRYSTAYKLFKKYIEDYPSGSFIFNAKEAVEYIDG